MEPITFPVYEPDGKKFHWSPDSVIVPLYLLPIFSAYFFEDYFKRHQVAHSFLILYVCIISVVAIYFLLASLARYKRLNGTLTGKITFNGDGIYIDNELFKLEGIENLDFRFYDYYGYRSSSSVRSLNPKMSQGINNYVYFTDENGDDQLFYFQLQKIEDYKKLVPFINIAIRGKKLSFKRGVELVGIENIWA